MDHGVAESVFPCGPDGGLVGILSSPQCGQASTGRPAVVLINAGNVHRAGPNRFYVNLARHFAAMGFATLRFDLSGIGDSPNRNDGRPYREYAAEEVCGVIDDLEQRLGVRDFILLGICAGADISFDAAVEDERVKGLVLINGAFIDAAAFAASYHRAQRKTIRRYYLKRVLSPRAWVRLLALRSRFWVSLGRGLKSRLKSAGASRPDTACAVRTDGCRRKWAALAGRGVSVLLMFAEGSVFWDMFRDEVRHITERLYPKDAICIVLQKRCDHTFTLLSAQEEAAAAVAAWLRHEGSTGGKP